MTDPTQESSPSVPEAEPSELQKLDTLIKNDRGVLFNFCSVFPFDLFPTCVSIEKNKVDIIDTIFFSAKQVKSIIIQEILQVEVETSLLFAKLRIVSRTPMRPVTEIDYLWSNDAKKAQRLIQGLITGTMQHIDLTQIPTPELARKAEQLGNVRGVGV